MNIKSVFNKKNKIAIVIESPFQLLCAYESIFYFNISNYTLYYRKTGKNVNDNQIKNIIKILKIENTIELNIPVNNIIVKLIKSFFFYINLCRYDFCILGRYTSEFIKPIRTIFKNKNTLYLDDGLETVEIQEALYNKNVSINMFSAFRYKIINEKAFFLNKFKYIKNKFTDMNSKEIIFVGSLNVEVGKQKESDYINIIKSIIKTNNIKELVYYPHRTENTDKLKRMSSIENLKIIIPNYTIELHLLLNKIEPEYIYSYYSTAIGTLNIIFPSAKITLLEPIHLKLKPMLNKLTKTSSDVNRINMVLGYLYNIDMVTRQKV